MRRTRLIVTALAAALTVSAATTSIASATPPPQWAGKGISETKTGCRLWFLWAWGWPSLTECQNNAGLGTFGKDRYGRWIFLDVAAKTSQKFSSSSQSIECSEVTGGGGINNLSSSMGGVGIRELSYSGCKVWKGKFESELKECHATSIENSGEAGEAGRIKLLVDSELVYLDNEGKTIGDLFLPAQESGNTRFALLDFTGTGCINSGQQPVSGDLLAEVKPQNEEVESVTETLPATALSKCWQWLLPATLKECSAVGLKAYGLTLTESGESAIKLESKEKFKVLN